MRQVMQSMGPLDQVMVPRSPLLAKAGADEEVPGGEGSYCYCYDWAWVRPLSLTPLCSYWWALALMLFRAENRAVLVEKQLATCLLALFDSANSGFIQWGLNFVSKKASSKCTVLYSVPLCTVSVQSSCKTVGFYGSASMFYIHSVYWRYSK